MPEITYSAALRPSRSAPTEEGRRSQGFSVERDRVIRGAGFQDCPDAEIRGRFEDPDREAKKQEVEAEKKK